MNKYAKIVLLGFLVVPIVFCAGIIQIERQSLVPLATKLGVSPTKVALIEYTTAILESEIGSSRAEVHEILEAIGGEFTIIEHGGGGQNRESAYWTMGKIPWGKIWAVFILEYDENWKLQSVDIGSS
jgi:hypothetical protein